MSIDAIIEGVIAREGGHVNDPNDAGGETMFGITVKTARDNGYSGPMRSLPRDLAARIYRKQYVSGPGFDQIESLRGVGVRWKFDQPEEMLLCSQS